MKITIKTVQAMLMGNIMKTLLLKKMLLMLFDTIV